MEKNPNVFDAEKYKWKGFKPTVEKGYSFRIKPIIMRGANSRELHFLWWRFCVLWWWNPHVIWNDGWDAHFRDTMYKDSIIESTKVYNRNN